MSFDSRTTLARADLAASDLEGMVASARFVPRSSMQVVTPLTAMRALPQTDAEQVNQLLFGEILDVIETQDGFAWGQARRDGYVGYVDITALSADLVSPTHWVKAPITLAFARPDIKSPPWGFLSCNALLAVDKVGEALVHAIGAGWIPGKHLRPIGQGCGDAVEVALSMMGAPYLWGGRSHLGLDCSGLVQMALQATGRACPRDTDQQQALGAPALPGTPERGDLVFWPGHVGLMLDANHLLHANAHHMAVAIEPLADAVARIGLPTAHRCL